MPLNLLHHKFLEKTILHVNENYISMKHSFIVIAAFTIVGCYKPVLSPEPISTFTIRGQLLESRSNAVPVSCYSLSLGQMTSIGPLGLIGDLDSV